ncbi:hypothetical protein P8S54_04860 [Thiomicrospira sp. R3]|nr:hypothetical protein [Thiomicrospira sp. R3]WFE69636.1 hypothetical protein P8S54_04860 [Thiomicrospira sp. R3]
MLDPKPTSSNKGLFRDALKRHYGYGSANAMIEWHGEDGVVGVDLKTKTVKTAKGKTFESTIHKDVYVIDDVAIATPLPKSGYAANSEANLAAVVTGKSMIEP